MKRLLLWVLLCLTASAQGIPGMQSGLRPEMPGPEGRWALLVGVSRYRELPERQWLSSCATDAADLALFLQSGRGGSFPADHVKLLTDQQATTQNVRLSMDGLIKGVRPGDVVWVFFACHGKVERYGAGDVAYLLMHDSNPEFLNATALPMDEVRRYVDVNLRQAYQIVFVTDACHAGALGAAPDPNQRLSSMADQLMNVGDRNGVLNIMACRRDESAVEDPFLGGHGVLTYALLRSLNGMGDSQDGVVRAQDVLEYVGRTVPRLTDQQQHPRHSTNYLDEFPMAYLKQAGPLLRLPDPRGSVLDAVRVSSPASLRVVGGAENSEFYLVRGAEQRTVGRVLSAANTLVLEGLQPGAYDLVQELQGKQTHWSIQLTPGSHSFNVRAGGLE
ncbi:caspase family protein [bacterium]|nr:caspase family protein [bacterium]